MKQWPTSKLQSTISAESSKNDIDRFRVLVGELSNRALNDPKIMAPSEAARCHSRGEISWVVVD